MKFLFGIVIFCILAQFSYTMDMEQAKELFMAAAEKCKGSTGVGEGDIEKFKKHELLESHEGKCFSSCVMKSLAIMTEDNKSNKPTLMMGIGFMYADNPENAKKAEEIINECMEITDSDECEAAFKIGQCWKAGKDAKGLPEAM